MFCTRDVVRHMLILDGCFAFNNYSTYFTTSDVTGFIEGISTKFCIYWLLLCTRSEYDLIINI